MPLKIIWTQTSKETYIYVLDYLNDIWGQKYVNNFLKKSNKIFNLISLNPQMFQCIYENETVRKGILHKNCSFLYRVNTDYIELLVFWDTRQEPFLT